MYKTLIVMALTVLTMSACYDKKTNEKTKEVITESQFKANTNNSKPLPNPPNTDLTHYISRLLLRHQRGRLIGTETGQNSRSQRCEKQYNSWYILSSKPPLKTTIKTQNEGITQSSFKA